METHRRVLRGVTLPGPRIGHHRNGQLEIGGQAGRHGNFQAVVALGELQQLIVQHPGPLEGYQGQSRVLSPIEAHRRLVADFVGVLIGQDSQPDLVFLARYLNHVLTPNRILEAVDAFRPNRILTALLQGQRLPGRTVGLACLDLVFLQQTLADLAVHARLLEDVEDQFSSYRLAFRVVGVDGNLEGLAGDVYRADRADADGESLRREEEIHGRLDVALRQRHHQRQSLSFVELAGGELELDLALVVGLGHVHSLVGQLIADLPAGKRGPVIEGGPNRALYLFAAVVDLAGSVDYQVHRLQLVLVDLKNALVAVPLLVVNQDAILPLGTRQRQDEMRVEAAEAVEFDVFLPDQPVSAVEDFQRVLLAFLDDVGIGRLLFGGGTRAVRRQNTQRLGR